MKQNKKLQDLTLEELYIQQKKLKGALIGIGIVMLLAVGSMLYLAIKNNNYSLIAVGIACSLTLLPSVIIHNQIKTEIKSRNSK